MAVRREIPWHWRGDGILTTLSGDSGEISKFFREAGCPVVSLNENKTEVVVPRVVVDVVEIGRMAAKHFLERSFQSFAFIVENQDVTTQGSLEGFGAVIGEAGFETHFLDWEKERGKKIPPADTCTGVFQNFNKNKLTAAGTAGGAAAATTTTTEGFGRTD